MNSEYLSRWQLAGLLTVGDILIPGDHELPSFSASRCVQHADRMLAYMNDADRNGVKLLLGMFRFFPRFLVRGIMWLTERHESFPEPMAAGMRLVNLGVKGVVMTLYYSGVDEGEVVYRLINWDAKVVGEPLPEEDPPDDRRGEETGQSETDSSKLNR